MMARQTQSWWERLRATVERAWSGPPGRARAVARRRMPQATPAAQYRGPAGPVERWSERRQMRGYGRGRRRMDHSPYALVFALVLVTLVVGVIGGLAWVLSPGGPFGNTRSGTSVGPTPVISTVAPAASPGVALSPPVGSPGPGGPVLVPITTPGAAASPVAGDTPAGARRIHRIQQGDTLARIATQYGVTIDAIMRANNITDRGRILRIGEELVIP